MCYYNAGLTHLPLTDNRSSRAVLQASSELTDTMRQAVQMMRSEVERSHESLKTLDESTKVLEKTHGQYNNLSSEMKTSGTLLTQIHRRDVMDRIIVLFGLFVFLSTVAYILWKRTWIPGASLLKSKPMASAAKSLIRESITQAVTSLVPSSTTETLTSRSTPTSTAHHQRDEL
jgi:hypothetical protein